MAWFCRRPTCSACHHDDELFERTSQGHWEAALVDGANWFVTMWKITCRCPNRPHNGLVSLFVIVNTGMHGFDGLIYMNLPENIPLMTILQSMVLAKFDVTKITSEQRCSIPSDGKWQEGRGDRGSFDFIMHGFPILLVYPFLQKYFVTRYWWSHGKCKGIVVVGTTLPRLGQRFPGRRHFTPDASPAIRKGTPYGGEQL